MDAESGSERGPKRSKRCRGVVMDVTNLGVFSQ